MSAATAARLHPVHTSPLEMTHERTLCRLLYETAARTDEVLRLNVEDLDIPAKRARTRS